MFLSLTESTQVSSVPRPQEFKGTPGDNVILEHDIGQRCAYHDGPTNLGLLGLVPAVSWPEWKNEEGSDAEQSLDYV